MAKHLFSKIRAAFASEEGDVSSSHRPVASEYVEWLPCYMLRTAQTELKIDSTLPLPGANESDPERKAPCLPDAETVINRIKVLCGLNPFRFPEPTEGHFEEALMEHKLKFTVYFDDSRETPVCTLYLSVSNH